jgi:hypothetical protein
MALLAGGNTRNQTTHVALSADHLVAVVSLGE